MVSTNSPKHAPPRTDPVLSPTKQRIVEAAVTLFAERGIHGTSLQDIADSLGVTKAAVYHQFKTKESIIMAAFGDALARIAGAVDEAETQADPAGAAGTLVAAMVELAVEKRASFRTLQGDPELARLLMADQDLRGLLDRQERMYLVGKDGPESRVRAALVASALGATATHRLVADIDDQTLNSILTAVARQILGVDTGESANA